MSKLVDFLINNGTDYEGRTLKDVHAFSFNQLEDLHDYIQWIFPLNEASQAVPWSPVLTDEDINEFVRSAKAEMNLFRSFMLMCNFYGFEVTIPDYDLIEVKVELESPKFCLAKHNWITPYNHNYLRLTRILKSLRLLGCDDWAMELFRALQEVYMQNNKIIGERTYKFWCDAVYGL